MKKIIVVMLFFLNQVLACTPVNKDPDPFGLASGFFKNTPENAEVAFTGKIIQESRLYEGIGQVSNSLIIPEKKWTEVNTDKIQVGSSFCDVLKPEGELYLYLSNKTNNHYELIRLKEAGSYIAKLAKKEDFIGEINPAWQYCKEDRECIATKNSCGVEYSVSWHNLEDFKKNESKIFFKFCSQKRNIKKLSLKCVNYFCE